MGTTGIGDKIATGGGARSAGGDLGPDAGDDNAIARARRILAGTDRTPPAAGRNIPTATRVEPDAETGGIPDARADQPARTRRAGRTGAPAGENPAPAERTGPDLVSRETPAALILEAQPVNEPPPAGPRGIPAPPKPAPKAAGGRAAQTAAEAEQRLILVRTARTNAESTIGLAELLAVVMVGPECEMQPKERAAVLAPLGRIAERHPELFEATGKWADPMGLVAALGAWGYRCYRVAAAQGAATAGQAAAPRQLRPVASAPMDASHPGTAAPAPIAAAPRPPGGLGPSGDTAAERALRNMEIGS